jgi:hypothetical protein
MGLRSRLKKKIKGTLEGVGVLAKVIHDEANHPGRPQPHMAARNPLWGGGDVGRSETEDSPISDSDAQVHSTTSDTTNQSVESEPEADYWFLHDPDGEADDWSKTNPKS